MTKVKTGMVRLTYAHLAEAYTFDEANAPKYSTGMIISKDDKSTIEQIKKNYEEAVESGVEKFGQGFRAKATPLLRKPGTREGLLVDGDEDDKYAGNSDYKNSWILTAKSTTAPGVLALEKGKRTLTPEEIKDTVYSGCYAKVCFNFYPYSKAQKGIACGLDSVLKMKDGENLGGHGNALGDWEEEIDQAVTDSLGDDYGDLL